MKKRKPRKGQGSRKKAKMIKGPWPDKKPRQDGQEIPPEEKKIRNRKEGISWILAVACSVVLVIVICTIWGSRINVTHGVSDPQELIPKFLDALDTGNVSKMKTMFFIHDGMYKSTYDSLSAHVSHERETIVSVGSSDVQVAHVDASDENVRAIWETTGVQAKEARLFYFEVPIARSLNGNSYQTTTTYYLTAYLAGGKWYLYDCVKDATYVQSGKDADGNDLDVSEAYALFNNRFVGGDPLIGYIPLDDTWYAMPPDTEDDEYRIDGAIEDLGYIQEEGGAVIHMVLLEVDEGVSLEDLNAQLTGNLSSDEGSGVAVDSMESTLSNCPAWCTGAYVPDADLYFFSWLVDARELDGYVRYLSFECVDGWQDAAGYITSFILPQHYVDRPVFDDEAEESGSEDGKLEIGSWAEPEEA